MTNYLHKLQISTSRAEVMMLSGDVFWYEFVKDLMVAVVFSEMLRLRDFSSNVNMKMRPYTVDDLSVGLSDDVHFNITFVQHRRSKLSSIKEENII